MRIPSHDLSANQPGDNVKVHYRFAEIDGHKIFYRDAGSYENPAIVLLHGFPTSSYMFRDLIPALADRYRIIAPDYLGFGLSDAPTVGEFDYTFDALADLTAALLDQIGVTRYCLYVQDYGAPIGWRLALADSSAITAIITQNGNAYEAGLIRSFWEPIIAYQHEQNPETERGARWNLTLEATRWQYTFGEPDQTLLNPEAWYHDYALISRPGNDAVQLKLFIDYATNVQMYPQVHQYFRDSQVPLLAVWGRGDGGFAPAGATAFSQDLPNAQIHLLDGGHFLLESALDDVAALIRDFLDQISFAA
jgi:pimeloyl-ACP methyl ester carboxylesterase